MSESDKSYSVTQINKYLKAVMDEDFILRNIRISGEVSNFRRNYSGHIYFTLKDEESSIGCVIFSGAAEIHEFPISDGLKVVVSGNISIYIKGGQYQIYVKKIVREGKGDLYERFEELKRKLQAEGIFDPQYKKPISTDPARIAVITSPTGAAVKDIISVARRRNKSINLAVFPVLVQGEKAAYEISTAIEDSNRLSGFDTIILGRGGGSIEDLWPFNEEIVARAIFNSCIPVISAVGHETDFTIADFAADYRAATPSVAAEIAVPLLKNKNELLRGGINLLNSSIDRVLKSKQRSLRTVLDLTEAVSPLNILKKGYSLTYAGDNSAPLKSVAHVKKGDTVTTLLSEGKIVSKVMEIRHEV